MNQQSLNVLILAGGKSSRMGQDKALVPWDGVPLLQRVYRTATELNARVWVMTPWPDRYGEILPPNCQWLTESQPGGGPLVALSVAFSQLSGEWILLLGCDLPLLRADILRGWIDRLDTLPASVRAMVPQQDEGWEPLCGFYRKDVQPELEQFLATGGRSFQNWLPQISVHPLSVSDAEAKMLRNCNAPEDLPG
ncbi:molybdenum cofactor guanylyltransferase [Oscillatoriales cyanobacterium LEGE 11467]|uniref:Probable molybdenum cofactor guanylyltransferase n=1 Tax=Zarconia navalis LEGE 11467 TaxID=1828826 RepID=A0A928Z9Z0_9CYAN|nr:molybdenum cofactor guanylyltransferase [Zarconia navalis]MBE9041231.1 molybdenum cofactor guanylyltransferase [Zarconia navalis LEGE 11467]